MGGPKGRRLLDVAFAAQLFGVLAVVAPLDVGFLVLPVPGFDEDGVALVDPDPVLHAAGDPAHPVFAVLTLDAHVVPAVVLGHDLEQLVVVWHPKVSTPCLFAHTYSTRRT